MFSELSWAPSCGDHLAKVVKSGTFTKFTSHERIQRGWGTGGPDPPGKSQKYRVFSNTGPDPLENHKATRPAFHDGPSSGRSASGPIMAPLLVEFGSSPHLIN